MNNAILRFKKGYSKLFFCITVTKAVLKQVNKMMMNSEETDSQSTVPSDGHPDDAPG